ncbi:hypothetical protein [Pedobacter sp. SYSU D00535]|uniref:hypothetical protein n=1 Tax=Pedobacter sp. SYSU D00535 TaxID=2810308 RepID=UPI001A96119D|nr:hypothetical protein [Pedobacter sp. SYSU D00535]
MSIVKEEAQVRKSLFTCHQCGSQLNYVQVLTNDLHIKEDFFECPICNNRIDSVDLHNESAEFYD